MISFNKEEYLDAAAAAFDPRKDIESAVDAICDKGFKNLFLVGIGGTVSYHYQLESLFKAKSTLPVFVENAAELLTIGNPHLGAESVVVIISVSGSTSEIIDAVQLAKDKGAVVLGLINDPVSTLAKLSDYSVAGNAKNRYIFFEASIYQLYIMAARFIYNHGEFPNYDEFIANLEKMPELLLEVRQAADRMAEQFVSERKDEPLHYIVASGNLWGGAYSFAMCVLEESLWVRTKSIHAAEFFHGTLEVIDKDTSVLLFKGEDQTRPLMDRVENFSRKICGKVTVFDTRDYELAGIDDKFRGLFSPLVVSALYERIAAHFEDQLKHPLEIRRYYRRFEY